MDGIRKIREAQQQRGKSLRLLEVSEVTTPDEVSRVGFKAASR
jgi:hypothetical protein